MATALSLVENKNELKTRFQGLAFLEFAASHTLKLHQLFQNMGFQNVQKHRRREITLYKQGNIRFLLNAEPDGFAASFASARGAAVCGIGLYVHDALEAFSAAVERGATPYHSAPSGIEAHIPTVHGPGDTLLYFIECGDNGVSALDLEFKNLPGLGMDFNPPMGLTDVHHIHFSLGRSEIQSWSAFFRNILGFSLDAPVNTESFLTPLREGTTLHAPLHPLTLTFQEHLSLPASFSPYTKFPATPTGVEFVGLSTNNLVASVHSMWRHNVTLLPQIFEETSAEIMDRVHTISFQKHQTLSEIMASSTIPGTSLAPRARAEDASPFVCAKGDSSPLNTASLRAPGMVLGHANTDTPQQFFMRSASGGRAHTHQQLYLWGAPKGPRETPLADLARGSVQPTESHYATIREHSQHEAILSELDLLSDYINVSAEDRSLSAPTTILHAQTHSLMGSLFFEFRQEVCRTALDTLAPHPHPTFTSDPSSLSALWGV